MIPTVMEGADLCLETALASLLEREDVPCFAGWGASWQYGVGCWLRTIGRKARWFSVNDLGRDAVPAGHWMAVVVSDRNEGPLWTHARVMRGRRIAFDPGETARSRRRRYLLGLEIS
jgi:hypothetical protein